VIWHRLQSSRLGAPKILTTQGDAPKQSSKSGLSCCPLETTLVQKWDSSAQKIEFARGVSLPVEADLLVVQHYTAIELAPPVLHRGRDTLLETHLLRI
jgi:hypothetical protein